MSIDIGRLNDLVTKRISTYSNDPSIFRSAYASEKATTGEYDGRQLLELLQNCDDAKAHKVEINWDTKTKTLVVSNKGTPFSIKGIESIMLAHTSPKTGKSFIGNKGLGFRSILNWADKVSILSGGCEISFSEEIAKDIFENTLDITDDVRKEIRNDLGLEEWAIPFPTLGIPVCKSYKTNEWATSIQIRYRQRYEQKIEEQLEQLCEEVLLFLKN